MLSLVNAIQLMLESRWVDPRNANWMVVSVTRKISKVRVWEIVCIRCLIPEYTLDER